MKPARQTSSTRRSRSSGSACSCEICAGSRCGNDGSRNAGGGREPETGRLGAVADDESDLGRVGSVRAGFDQRLQIGSAARDQHPDPQPRHRCSSELALPYERLVRQVRLPMASSQNLLYDRSAAAGSREYIGSEAVCNGTTADDRDRRRAGAPAWPASLLLVATLRDAAGTGAGAGSRRSLFRNGKGRRDGGQRRGGAGGWHASTASGERWPP